MTIYTQKLPDYRKLYKQFHGYIPIDNEGRSYDIHHKDGDRNNNSISNLVALSIKEHYDIHYAQGDYGACLKMSARMKISPEEKSRIAKLNANKRVKDGTHNFLGNENNQSRINDGTHHLLGPAENQRRLDNGTHHFLEMYVCPNCGKKGKSPVMKRWHFDNCRNKLMAIQKNDSL